MASSFESTLWTVIDQARHPDEEVRRMALERIARAYYPPMMSYLTRLMGASHAEDCLQEFMGAKFLNGFFDRDWNRKERFRNFLKKCLKHHATDFFRKLKRKSNLPNLGEGLPEELPDEAAPDMFDLDWARNVLQESVDVLYAQCQESEELRKVWTVFRARTLQPCLEHEPAEPYKELNARLGIQQQRQTDGLLTKGKRMFGKALSDALSKYAANRHEVRTEFRDLMHIVKLANEGLSLSLPGDEQIDALFLLDNAAEDVKRISQEFDLEAWQSLLRIPLSDWLSDPTHKEALGLWGRHTLANVLLSPNPPLIAFQAIKDEARTLKELGAGSSNVNQLIRCLTIAAALVRHGQLISKAPVRRLYSAFYQLSNENWYGDAYRALLLEALGKLSELAS